LALVERRITALKGAQASEGRDLAQREADALAGDWYREFTTRHSDNPGHPKPWRKLREYCIELVEAEANEEQVHNGYANEEMIFSEPRELLVKLLDTTGRVGQFLTDRGVVLTQAGSRLFYAAAECEFLRATELLERRARGDWGPDRHMAELAPYQPLGNAVPGTAVGRPNGNNGSTAGSSAPAVTAVALFEAYCADKKPKPSTIDRWRHVFPALDTAGWQGLDWDAQRWADSLVGPDNSAVSVRNTWIAAPRAVWNWAKRKRLVSSNPFVGVTIEVPSKPETRETGKAFTDEEAATILRAALAIPTIPRTKAGSIVFAEAAHRWAPWLMAYTGARVGELTQARVCDVQVRAFSDTAPAALRGVEYAVLRITPEAGPVKTDKARTIPLHPHLIEQGLLDYVEAVRAQQGADAPLFNTGKVGKGRGPGTRGREKLAAWVRSLSSRCPSLANESVQPNHGWRHTFKQRARRAGIEPGIRDAICGHAPRSVAEQYEHVPVEDMAVAMRLFTRWAPTG